VLGGKHTKLTLKQADHIGVPVDGPNKLEYYQYKAIAARVGG
jgi:hypothetical protein